MVTREWIASAITEIADRNYEKVASHFKGKAHFKSSLERCYALLANKTCQEWNELNGIDPCLTKEDFMANFMSLAFGLKNTYIHSNDLKKAFPSYRFNGKKKVVPYSKLLKMLSDGGIIHVNNSYSSGKESAGHDAFTPFSKSYGLDFCFMFKVIGAYFDEKPPTEPFNIYKCFCAYFPNRLLDSKVKEAKSLYDNQVEIEGLRVVLPHGWENQLSPFGCFSFDEELSIDKLILGLKSFKTNKPPRCNGGRTYDWFTACPSSFRRYIYKGDRHYRELIDCHSGIFWMFALHGYRNGRIGGDECLRMIDHCFNGTFYTDVSKREKTKAVKRTFMRVLNMSRGQERYMEEMRRDALFIHIRRELSRSYPQWSSYLVYLKRTKHGEIGRYNHYRTIDIEKIIMDELRRRLESIGLTDLRRVHDALYGLEDVAGIEGILYTVTMDYFHSIKPRRHARRTRDRRLHHLVRRPQASLPLTSEPTQGLLARFLRHRTAADH